MGSMNQTILSKTPVQMRHVRHAELQEDTEAYPDVMEPARRRSISHVLGQHPKAVLRDSHKFHLDYLVSGAATEPPLHSHDYSEIFMRSEEHTSELQSLMRISYAVFCLKNKKK